MPQSKHFDGVRRNTVVEMVTDSAEVDSPDTGQILVERSRAHHRMRRNQGKGFAKFLLESLWC
jgi:hypothetical protein